jgi:hypothetical protein
MYHPVMLEAMARARRQDLLREADARRLARQAREGQPGLADRLLEELGDLLVETGERLQKRSAPQGNGTLGKVEA